MERRGGSTPRGARPRSGKRIKIYSLTRAGRAQLRSRSRPSGSSSPPPCAKVIGSPAHDARPRCASLFWPVPVEPEVDEELAAHLELQTRRYVGAGMTPTRRARARSTASATWIAFATSAATSRHRHGGRHAPRRVAARSCARTRGFALRGVRRSAAVHRRRRCSRIASASARTRRSSASSTPCCCARSRIATPTASSRSGTLSRRRARRAPRSAPAECRDLREQLRAFDAVAALRPQRVERSPATGGEPERVNAYVVSPNLFDLLGTAPARSARPFAAADGTPGRAARRPAEPRALAPPLRRRPGDRRAHDEPQRRCRAPSSACMPAGGALPRRAARLAARARRPVVPHDCERARSEDARQPAARRVRAPAPGATARRRAARRSTRSRARFRARLPRPLRRGARAGVALAAVPLRDEMVGGARPALLVVARAPSGSCCSSRA